MDLTRNKKVGKWVLAVKFLTRRIVNIEAVAQTFRPLWRTRREFEVSDAGNNVVLFDFMLEADVEKVLMGEPWSFDRHIVVLELGMAMGRGGAEGWGLHPRPAWFCLAPSPSRPA